jgi:hypothetical protein
VHGMKREIAFYIARCNFCQRVMAEHQRPIGLLQPLKVPMWKWEEVGMDFITRLPMSSRGHDSIWVMSTHASFLVDSVGPPSAEVCRTAASFP